MRYIRLWVGEFWYAFRHGETFRQSLKDATFGLLVTVDKKTQSLIHRG